MDPRDEVIECPCYRVCAGLSLEMKRWCRYRKSDLPPPGLWWVRPKEEGCPAGVQAGVLTPGYTLSEGGSADSHHFVPVTSHWRECVSGRRIFAPPIPLARDPRDSRSGLAYETARATEMRRV